MAAKKKKTSKKSTTTKAAAKPSTKKSSPSRKPAAKAPAKKRSQTQPAKLSALDAAAKVLAESGQPMNCREMIDAMAAQGYWKSPGGKTPSATLYSAILRQLQTQGKDARFRKVERGKFALNK